MDCCRGGSQLPRWGVQLVAKTTQASREDLLDVREAQAGEPGDVATGQVAAESKREDLAFALGEPAQCRLEIGIEPEALGDVSSATGS